MTATAPTAPPPVLETADAATVQAALDDLGDDIAHLRDLTRQANATAGLGLTAVGLVAAAATAVLPRLSGAPLTLAAIAVALVALAGAAVGAALVPRPRRSRHVTPSQMAAHALHRVTHPRRVLLDRAAEACNLTEVAYIKHRFIRLGLWLMGLAFLDALAAAITLAVTALT